MQNQLLLKKRLRDENILKDEEFYYNFNKSQKLFSIVNQDHCYVCKKELNKDEFTCPRCFKNIHNLCNSKLNGNKITEICYFCINM